MKRSGRIRPSPAIWQGRPCSRLRAPLRARRPEPWTQLSCLGPGHARTARTNAACSCSRAHGVFIFRTAPSWAGVTGGRYSLDSRISARTCRMSTPAPAGLRSARGRARRCAACSMHSGRGWIWAPRPGRVRSRSTAQPPGLARSATMRTSVDAGSRVRHPMHIRRGDRSCARTGSPEEPTAKSTRPAELLRAQPRGYGDRSRGGCRCAIR
jgi:hypothetical protein